MEHNSALATQIIFRKQRKFTQPLHGVTGRVEFGNLRGSRSRKKEELETAKNAQFFSGEGFLQVAADMDLVLPVCSGVSEEFCLSGQREPAQSGVRFHRSGPAFLVREELRVTRCTDAMLKRVRRRRMRKTEPQVGDCSDIRSMRPMPLKQFESVIA